MDGPAAYLREHRDEVLAALAERDLSPEVLLGDARDLPLPDGSIQLVVTSPPYPMIAMWDELFQEATGLEPEDPGFFEASHRVLDGAWAECERVLAPGGILAVNVGDATRTVSGRFRLFPNHVRVADALGALGLDALVPVWWRKPTNRPNSFLGSGFLPPNAYVTLDCEAILLYRKGGPRKLPPHDPLRYASQFSKAERDRWFTQVWDVRADRQDGTATFPLEVPRRLVRMFSVLGDAVLDPFAGTGTTLLAARELGRKAVGVEQAEKLVAGIRERLPIGAPEPEAVVAGILEGYEG